VFAFVDVWAFELPVPAVAEVDVEVEVFELAAPEPSLVALLEELVEVDAWGPVPVELQPAPLEPPAEVDEVDPVLACPVALPFEAWLPLEVVVPVWAFDAPEPAWLLDDVLVPVWALAPPELAWLPLEVVVPACAFEEPLPA
jgi:hypothetical protein